MADLPSQYAEEVEIFRHILDLLTPGKPCPGLPLLFWAWTTKNPLPPLQSDTRWDSLVMRTKSRFEYRFEYRSVSLQNPLESLWARFPDQFLRNWNIKLGRTYPLSTSWLPSSSCNSSCNSTLEKCQHSLNSSFKRVKSQIQKGANPEKAARRGYEQACEYLEIRNKTILIPQRALACLSKSLAHILQRELYTMGNTGLLRREADMILLKPHIGDTRCQELRNSPFWPSSLFKSQLVKEGEDFLLKKRHL